MELARTAKSKAALTAQLEERFPRVVGSAAALHPLRSLFHSACPGEQWTVRGFLSKCCSGSCYEWRVRIYDFKSGPFCSWTVVVQVHGSMQHPDLTHEYAN